MAQRGKVFGQEQVKVDAQKQKQFKFGNAQVHRAEFLVFLPQKIGSQSTALGVYALDVPNAPVLIIGIKTLRQLGAKIDTVCDTIEFCKVFSGIHVPLLRGRNGHLLLNLCQDWMPLQASTVSGNLESNLTVDRHEQQKGNSSV